MHPRPLLFVLASLLSAAAVAQPLRQSAVRSATGVVVAASDSGAAASPSLGLDATIPLAGRFAVRLGYRTFDAGDARPWLHALDVGARWEAGGPLGLGVEAGALTARSLGRDGQTLAGPRLGLSGRVPLTDRWALTAATAASALFPDDGLDGAADGLPADIVTEATVGLAFTPFRSSCEAPASWAVEAPATLAPYEPGVFRVEAVGRGAVDVTWAFGDGLRGRGRAVERVFVDAGAVPFSATIEHCGGVAVVEGVVEVAEPCWAPPVIDRVVQTPVAASALRPVELAVEARGTGPLEVRWRHASRADSGATFRFPLGLRAPAEVEVEVRNCTGRVARRRVPVVVAPDAPPDSVVATFELNSCAFAPAPPETASAPGVPFQTPTGDLAAGYLANLAHYLDGSPDRRLLVRGYADWLDATYNWDLSGWRAETARRYLLRWLSELSEHGPIDPSRIVPVAMGVADRPVCDPLETLVGCLEQRRAVVSPLFGEPPPEWTPTAWQSGPPPDDRGAPLPPTHDCRTP